MLHTPITSRQRHKGRVNPLRSDPTRTGIIRAALEAQIVHRFDRIIEEVLRVIGDEDALGLIPTGYIGYEWAPTSNFQLQLRRWGHLNTIDKVKQFREWLREVIKEMIHTTHYNGHTLRSATSIYSSQGYRQGATRSYDDVKGRWKYVSQPKNISTISSSWQSHIYNVSNAKKATSGGKISSKGGRGATIKVTKVKEKTEVTKVPPKQVAKSISSGGGMSTVAAKEIADIQYEAVKGDFLRTALTRRASIETVQLLEERTLSELEGVSDVMATRMSRTLVQGLQEGKGPRQIADDLVDEVDISKGKATTIARTEIVRAHAEGQLLSLRKLGVEQLGVDVEWSTTGDDLVCPRCEAMEGKILPIAKATGLIPLHPNCRCAWIPAIGSLGEGEGRESSELVGGDDLDIEVEIE